MADGTEVGKGYVSVEVDKKKTQADLSTLGADLGGKMGSVGALLGQQLGSKMSTGIGNEVGGSKGGIMQMAGLLGKGGPWGIAAGAAVAGAAAIGVGLYKMGDSFESAYRSIARNTGATGKDMDSLKAAFKDVAKSGPASFDQVATAITGVQRYTGPTGKSLEGLSKQFITMSRITGTDLKSNMETGVQALERWNITADKAPTAMNQLFTASQKSGVSFSELANSVTKFEPQLNTMGFSFAQSSAMLAQFGKTGVQTPKVMAALQIGAAKIAKEHAGAAAAVDKARDAVAKAADAQKKAKPGSDAYVKATETLKGKQNDLTAALETQAKAAGTTVPKEFNKIVDSIKNAHDKTDALNIATQTFGSRGAVAMVDAIRTGKFNFDEMSKSVENSGNSIQDTADRTKTLGGAFGTFKNSAAVALEPLSTATFKGINAGLIGMLKGLTSAANYLPHIFNAVGDAINWVNKAVRNVYEAIKPLRQGIGAAFTQLGRIVSDVYAVVQPMFRAWIDIWKVIINLLTGNWAGAWNAAKDAVLSAIRALAQVPKLIFDYITWPFTMLGPTVSDALHGFWDTVSAIPGKVVSTLASLGAAVWGAISGGFGQAIGGAGAGLAAFWGYVSGVAGTVGRFFANIGGEVWGAMQRGFGRAVEGANAGLSSLWGTVSGIGGKIINKLGSIGTDLYNYGVNMMKRFGDGITDAIGHVTGAIGGAFGKIKSLIPGSPAKEGPFNLQGWNQVKHGGSAIIEQMASGITAAAPMLTHALDNAAAPVLNLGPFNPDSQLSTGSKARFGPAVVVQEAHFHDELDINVFMRQAGWLAQTQGV